METTNGPLLRGRRELERKVKKLRKDRKTMWFSKQVYWLDRMLRKEDGKQREE